MANPQNSGPRIPYWMRGILLLAAAYNFVWGMLILFFPAAYIHWLSKGMVEPSMMLIKGVGAAVFLVGALLMMATIGKPASWVYILAAFIAKAMGGPLVYIIVLEATFSKPFLFQVVMSDLIWLPPLFNIMRHYKILAQAES